MGAILQDLKKKWRMVRKKVRQSFKKPKKELFIDFLIAFFVFMVVVFGGLFIWIATLDIPDLDAFGSRQVLQSTKIYDRSGEILLYDLHQDLSLIHI